MEKAMVRLVRILIVTMFILPFIILPVNASMVNNALNFDGTNDMVSIDPFPTAEGDISFSAWVKLDTTTGFRTFASWAYPGDNLLIRNSNGNLQLIFNNEAILGGPIPADVWQHVAFTKSGENFELYLNGVLKSSGPLGVSDQSFTAFHLGSLLGTMHYFDGEMDDVAVWNRLLSAGEIQAFSAAPLTGSEPDLIGCYGFDEGGGTNLADISGGGNDGILNNFSLSGTSSNWVPSTVFSPTNITLSSSSINENSAADSTVGTFSSTDPEAGDSFTYSLESGTGSTDNASFSISGDDLRITSSPDYETKSSYSVRVRTTDQSGLYYEKAFTVTINDVSEGPITLSVAVPANATYTAGQTLNFTVTYNENITVDTLGGTPSIPVILATGTVNAGYLNGSGTQNLVFRYTVADGNSDPDGVSVGSAIALNGGTLKSAGAVDADLNLNSVASTINIRVDALAPTATIIAGTTAGGDLLVGVSEKAAGFNVVARSSEGNGTLYVVPSGTAKNMGAITGAAIGSAPSAGANSDTTIAIAANNPGVINGFVYKVYAVDAAGNISAISSVAFTADFSGPTLTAGAVNRTSDTAGTVKFTSNEAGKYYYEIVADGAAAPSVDTGGAGTDCTTTEETITNPIGLTAGAKDFYIVVKDAANNVSSAIKIDIAGHIEPDSAAPTLTAGAANRTSDTAGTVKFTSNEAGKYYYEIVADGAAAPSIDTNGAGTDCTTSETTLTDPAGLTPGAKDIYIVVKDAANNVSGAIKIDIAAHIEPDSTAPTLTAGAVNRTSDTAGTVKFTSNEAGKYYYVLVADGAAAPTVDTSGAGTDCTTAEATITNPTGLTAGAKDIYIVVKDAAENVSDAIKIDIAAYMAPSGGSSGGGGGGSSVPVTPPQTPVTIIVNGDGISAGTSQDTVSDGEMITTITVDEQKLEQKLDQSGSGAVVTVPANTDSGTVIGELNGQMVKNMETHQAVLEIKNNTATYTLPAGQINIDAVSQQFGTSVSLKDIKVQIEIVKGNQGTATLAERAAVKGEFTIVAPPVEFNVRCTYAGKTVEVSKFNAYVERTVAIPVGVDPAKITTGVIVDTEGTVRHVPTQIIIIDSKYYAKINSLTNSTYSVVYNPVYFKDVETHWAKASVNNMGSRMVVSGAEKGQYEPDRSITRAEFAAIVVRALGLKPGTGTNSFNDVSTKDWYCKSIETSSSYGIITGYDKTTFGPNEKITREQAMAMIARTLNITGLKVTVEAGDVETLLAGYADSPLSSAWAKEGTAICIKSGIVSGKGAGTLAPQDEITRAEVAVIIERLLKKSGLI